MRLTIEGKQQATYNFKTGSILKSYICGHWFVKWDWLKTKPNRRQSLYFFRGLNRLDKEADLGYIIQNVRIMRYFLKMVLDKDQRVLLKLKSKEFLDTENEKDILTEVKRTYDEDTLLNLYIEYIMQKKTTKTDEKLMSILGFKEAFKLITESKIAKQKENELIDQSAFKGISSEKYNGDTAILGASNAIKSYTKRNPHAKQLCDDWNKMAASTLKDMRNTYLKAEKMSSADKRDALAEKSPTERRDGYLRSESLAGRESSPDHRGTGQFPSLVDSPEMRARQTPKREQRHILTPYEH